VLRFVVHHLQLRKRHFILLPKLTLRQLRFIAESLERRGCSIISWNPIVARSKEGSIRVTMAGLCTSAFDASDLVLPIVPDLLTFPKEEVPIGALQGMYFRELRAPGSSAIRLSTRLEYSSVWSNLRREGGCALAPDEHMICTSVIRSARRIGIVADFPSFGAEAIVVGRQRYFKSTLAKAEALATLRVIGKEESRNSYLARDGTLRLIGFSMPGKRALIDLFAGLGEWCFFRPIWGESSNWRPERPNAAPVV
jgi:hypothetical protein